MQNEDSEEKMFGVHQSESLEIWVNVSILTDFRF